MAGAIPTAIFALVGGAVSDRFPAKLVATVANLANTFLAGILTILIWLDAAHLPLLVAIVALAGLADAFAYPAINTLPPRFLNKARFVRATTWMQGTEQLKEAIGPALAGLAIATLGLPMSFAFYTVLFAIGSGLIFSIHMKWKPVRKHSPENFYTSEQQPHEVTSLVGEIMTGLRYAWWQSCASVQFTSHCSTEFRSKRTSGYWRSGTSHFSVRWGCCYVWQSARCIWHWFADWHSFGQSL
ncbi:MFS transporter [bacterium]|nr:MFS transporter [bacterium]